MRVNAKEALAKGYEAHNVQDGIWRELMQLHAVNEKKPTKEFVGRDRKAAKEEGEEHYPPAFVGTGHGLIAEELHLRRRREQPELTHLAEVALGEFGALPPYDPRFSGGGIAGCARSNFFFPMAKKGGAWWVEREREELELYKAGATTRGGR